MYGIFTYIWLKFMVHVAKDSNPMDKIVGISLYECIVWVDDVDVIMTPVC